MIGMIGNALSDPTPTAGHDPYSGGSWRTATTVKPWTADGDEAYGSDGRQSAAIEMKYGKLKVSELALGQVAGTAASRVVVAVDGKEVPAILLARDGRFVVRFPVGLCLEAGQKTEPSLTWA